MKRRAEPLGIALLGGFQVHSAGGEPISLPSRNAQGLLAYLAMSAGRAQARDKLATLIWGGNGADQARASLRQTLSRLRRTLNGGDREALRGEGDAIVIEASAVSVDAVRFGALVSAGTPEALEDAWELYHGSFLEGFGPLADPFEAWLMTERMRLHELAEIGLTRLLEHYRCAHATEDAIRVALRLLKLDALQESVHRLLMTLYAERGRLRSALKQYELCRDLLQRELGVEPERETQQLAEQIRSKLRAAVTPGSDVPSQCPAEMMRRRSTDRPIEHEAPRVDVPIGHPVASTTQAERRFVTLMACSLVDAAALSTRLDPEKLRAVIAEFEDSCERLVSRHGGHISHFEGHSVTAVFGYPRTDEHDAERAVRAGLDIVATVGRLAPLRDIGIQSRVSIASGEVVVGKRVHEDGGSEEVIAGATPYVVASLLATADPDSVLVAESTKGLLGALFEYEGLGERALQGFDAPVRVWRVLSERAGQSRFEATRAITALTPLVGREEEIELLTRRWEQAKKGSGQVVVLVGEPGIGKSRLIEALRAKLAGETYLSFNYYCSPHHPESALYPVIQQLERAAGYARDDPPAIKLEKLEALLAQATDNLSDAVPLIADLLSIPTEGRYPRPNLTPQRQKEKTLEVLDAQLARLTRRLPALAVFEDVHWSDPSTHEVLERLVERAQTLPLLMVVTHRPGTSIPQAGEPHVTVAALKRLTRGESEALVTKLTGERRMPKEVLAQIVSKADGVPLFIEELTKSALEAGVIDHEGGRHAIAPPLKGAGVPNTLHDLLLARLDRLGQAKAVAQHAAVIGRGFSYALLAAVTTLGEPELRASLAKLTDAELVYAHGAPPDARYTFKHALVRDAAYASLLRADRPPLHARIAKALEEQFPETKETEPAILAHHFAGAGLKEKAIFYWQSAGELAIRRSAQREAIAYFDKALESLNALPQTAERSKQELQLQVLLGQAWVLAEGYAAPAVAAAYDRARDLCEAIGDPHQLFSVLLGSWQLYIARAELALASDIAERLLSLALSQENTNLAVEAHVAQLVTLHAQGEFDKTLAHANEAIALYDSEARQGRIQSFGYDGRVMALTVASWALWMLGYPDQALKRMHETLATARNLAYPYCKTMALVGSAWVHLFRREAGAARELAEQAVALSIEHGFAWTQAYATPVSGWALAEEGLVGDGIGKIREGLAALEQIGHRMRRPQHQGLLAEACARAGQIDEALAMITQALDTATRTGVQANAAELHRLKGELLLQQGAPRAAAEAEGYFGRAIEIARRQRAKSWELRAATSLARLWRDQGKRKQARKLLSPVYDWFTEGFDTPDLREAGALLDTLASGDRATG